MENFNLYPQAWALYIALGLVLLFLLDLKLRKFGFKTRVAILSLIAVGAFTPETVRDASSFAPLILTSLFNAELDGVSSIYKGLTTLVIVWGIVFASILGIRHLIGASRSGNKVNEHEVESEGTGS